MIKARANDNSTGEPVYILGLSDGNLRKLREGLPITVELQQLGSTGRIVIMHGTTELEIIKELQACGLIASDQGVA